MAGEELSHFGDHPKSVAHGAFYQSLHRGILDNAETLNIAAMDCELPVIRSFNHTVASLITLVTELGKIGADGEDKVGVARRITEVASTAKNRLKMTLNDLEEYEQHKKLSSQERKELQHLRAQVLRYQFKEMDGLDRDSGESLRMQIKDQSRLILDLTDQRNELTQYVAKTVGRQKSELGRLQSEFCPLENQMRKWQLDIRDVRDAVYVRGKHEVDTLQADVGTMSQRVAKLEKEGKEALSVAMHQTENIIKLWALKQRKHHRLQKAYNSLMPYIVSQNVTLEKNQYDSQTEHLTLAQGIDCLREELDELDSKYVKTAQGLEEARAECNSMREHYINKIMEQRNFALNTHAIERELVKHEAKKSPDVSSLQRKHQEELKIITKRHEIELKLRDQDVRIAQQESVRVSQTLAASLVALDEIKASQVKSPRRKPPPLPNISKADPFLEKIKVTSPETDVEPTTPNAVPVSSALSRSSDHVFPSSDFAKTPYINEHEQYENTKNVELSPFSSINHETSTSKLKSEQPKNLLFAVRSLALEQSTEKGQSQARFIDHMHSKQGDKSISKQYQPKETSVVEQNKLKKRKLNVIRRKSKSVHPSRAAAFFRSALEKNNRSSSAGSSHIVDRIMDDRVHGKSK